MSRSWAAAQNPCGKNPMGKIHGGKSRMDSWGKNLKNHWETLRTVGFLVDHLEWMDFMDLASGKLTKNELESEKSLGKTCD